MDQPLSTTQSSQYSSAQLSTRRALLVYLFLLSGVTITILSVAVLLQLEPVLNFVKNHFVITVLLVSLFMTVNTSMFNRVVYEEHKLNKVFWWTMNCVLAAVPLLNIDTDVLVKAIIYTLILFLILSLKAFIVPENAVEMFLRPLTAIHSVVLVCTAYSVLFSSLNSTVTLIVSSICLHGGFLVYSGLLICNTQRLFSNAKHPRFDPVFSSFVLYMNILNLFSRVAVFSTLKTAVIGKDCNSEKK